MENELRSTGTHFQNKYSLLYFQLHCISLGRKAGVVIMSDGKSTGTYNTYRFKRCSTTYCILVYIIICTKDGDMAAAMQPLKYLPVWVVVRLCTDEEQVLCMNLLVIYRL